MSPTLFETLRSALARLSYTNSLLRPSRAHRLPSIRQFHALRPITRLPPEHLKFGQRAVPPCPSYPYGPRHTFKEADSGLYGGAHLQSGNKISSGRNKGKTLRRWYPNVRLETIRSEALNQTMTIRITAACMRTIRKCGGLDQYLLGDKPARIKELGVFGWRLRWRVMNSPMMRQKFQKERENLGLPPSRQRFETFEEAWENDEELRREVREEQQKQWQALREKEKRFRKHVRSRWEAKDKKKYRSGRAVPEFDAESFNSLIPEKES